MSKEIKIILALFGGLAVLLGLGVVALFFAIPRLGGNFVTEDPKDERRIAAKIATFDLPRGYRIENAVDIGIQQYVTIVRTGDDPGTFSIELLGQDIPSRGNAAEAGETIGAALSAKCRFHDEPDDVVKVRGRRLSLHVRSCAKYRTPLLLESGNIEGNDAFVRVEAGGLSSDFDAGALHALLRSIR